MNNTQITALAAACLFGLAACGNDAPPASDPPVAPATTTAPDTASTDAPPTAATPADAGTATPAASAPAPADNGKPAAVVNDCSTTIEGNDAMQFDVGSITVPSSCSEFTITLEHTGQMPVAAMGHNVVISKAADREAVAQAGMSAGVDGDYVDPNDERVIAHTELIGGGESTSVTFPVSDIQGDGPYEFFCSFPGHWAVMRGSIQVG
ncbi:azurin [Novilysobacter spongiicola]|uniref:Azurin n=1 Tax=Lysobacter spongiicola DSM 21749 TaxID=1122188 RepID=A0A1T4SEG8_9GAMM|nr:azurin [Lysobacter spongiicola]SKA26700.1 azurin [Lysobacter spongiicola DSM 21749]